MIDQVRHVYMLISEAEKKLGTNDKEVEQLRQRMVNCSEEISEIKLRLRMRLNQK